MRRIVLATLGLVLIAAPLAGQTTNGRREAYASYAQLLSRYVEDGRVDYARWQADDPAAWRQVLEWLDATDPAGWPIDDQRAFWINAYNARVIAGVLERYPVSSVRDIGFLGGRIRGFFGRQEHPVAGRRWTLDEIEQEVLLGSTLWDARIHWALSCASLSCPRLRAEPYRGDELDKQLDFQARAFLNSPDGHRLDRDEGTLHLTRIFDWYSEDFERAAGSVREYAARYLTGAAEAAAGDPSIEIAYLDYDWGLNEPAR